jgi:hypothetical protein
MFPSALRIFSRSLCVLATVAVFSASCSRQPEGERCDYEWAGPTQDCDSGLVCTPCGNLQNSPVDRCCRNDNTFTDPRCAPSTAPNQTSCSTRKETSTGGTGGTAGSAGTSSMAGSATSGGMSASGGSGATAGSAQSTAGSAQSMSGNAGESTAGGGN